jgi:hypothetical protein
MTCLAAAYWPSLVHRIIFGSFTSTSLQRRFLLSRHIFFLCMRIPGILKGSKINHKSDGSSSVNPFVVDRKLFI